MVIYLTKNMSKCTNKELATILKKHHSTVTHAMSKIEESLSEKSWALELLQKLE